MNVDPSQDPRGQREAQVTAWLLGELSAEEAAEVRAALAHDPELARWHDRLEKTIGWVRQVSSEPDEQNSVATTPLRLSERLRDPLLQRFKTVTPREFQSSPRRPLPWFVPMAVAAALVALLALIALPPMAKAKARAQHSPMLDGVAPPQAGTDVQVDAEATQTIGWGRPALASAGDARSAKEVVPIQNRPDLTPESAPVSGARPTSRRSDASQGEPGGPTAFGAIVVAPAPPQPGARPEARAGAQTIALPASLQNPDVGGIVSTMVGEQDADKSLMKEAAPPTGAQGRLAGGDFDLGPGGGGLGGGGGARSGGGAGFGGGGGGFVGRAPSGGVASQNSPVTEPTAPAGVPMLNDLQSLAIESGARGVLLANSAPSPVDKSGVTVESLTRNNDFALAERVALQGLEEARKSTTLGLQVNTATPTAEASAAGRPGAVADSRFLFRPKPLDETLSEQDKKPGIVPTRLADRAEAANGIAMEVDGLRVSRGNSAKDSDRDGAAVLGDTPQLGRLFKSESAPIPRDLNLGRQLTEDRPLAALADGGKDRAEIRQTNESLRKEITANLWTESALEGSATADELRRREPALPGKPAQPLPQPKLAERESWSFNGATANFGNTTALSALPSTSEKSESKKLPELRDVEVAFSAGTADVKAVEEVRDEMLVEKLDSKPQTLNYRFASPEGLTQMPGQRQGGRGELAQAAPSESKEKAGQVELSDAEAPPMTFFKRVEPDETRPAAEPQLMRHYGLTPRAEGNTKGNAVSPLAGKKPAASAPAPSRPLPPAQEDMNSLAKNKLGASVPESELVRQTMRPAQPTPPGAASLALGELARQETSTRRSRLTEQGDKAQKEAAAEAVIPDRQPEAIVRKLEEAKARIAPAAAPVPQPEVQTSQNPFSTFSLNVSDVSFRLAAAGLEKGVMPDPATVRSEEFINALDYRDSEPPPGVPIAFAWERARSPYTHNRDLLRLSVKTAAQGRTPGRPINLVVLLDNSGSMERADRVRIIREALRVLASQLQPQDKLSLIAFARTARLWSDGVPGSEAPRVAEQAGNLTPQGGTNLEDAMTLAYQTAVRHYLGGGVNRIVLLTDGAANLGHVDPLVLQQMVETHRQQGIALDCFGIGWEGMNDDLLEVLSRHGDGRYGFLNTPEEAGTEFAGKLAGALRVAASDVKVQVEFNPKRVTSYRQIGYAKHQLKKEQFRDNSVDAAEIGAAEAGNALYLAEVNPAGEGVLAVVRVRYKLPGTTDYHEMEWPVPYAGKAPALDQAGPALRLASTASAFSEWLVASPWAAEVTPERLLADLRGVPEVYGADARPKKLEWMIRQAQTIAGK